VLNLIANTSAQPQTRLDEDGCLEIAFEYKVYIEIRKARIVTVAAT
jgi:hypothetical protein